MHFSYIFLSQAWSNYVASKFQRHRCDFPFILRPLKTASFSPFIITCIFPLRLPVCRIRLQLLPSSGLASPSHFDSNQ